MIRRGSGTTDDMAALVVVLLVLLAIGALGAVVKGLLWLAAIALLLCVAAGIYGWFKFRDFRRSWSREAR